MIEFKVLWFENDVQTKWYDHNKEIINRHLESLGFRFSDTRIIDTANFAQNNDIFSQTASFDLILVDLKTDDSTGNSNSLNIGQEIIKKIRESGGVYSEILFYSSAYDDLKKELISNDIFGVFIAHRSDFRYEVLKLIDHILRKSLTPEIMRGAIIGSIAHLDTINYEIIELLFKVLDTSTKDQYCVKKIKNSLTIDIEQISSSNNDINKLSDEDLLNYIQSTIKFDSSKRSNRVLKIYKGLHSEENLFSYQEVFDNINDIINIRNKLAHWKQVLVDNDKIHLEDHSGLFTFDHEIAKTTRQKINKIYEALISYKVYLNKLIK